MLGKKQKQEKVYFVKAKEAIAWLETSEGEMKLKENFAEAKNFTKQLSEKRQISNNKLKEVVTI